MAAAQISRTPSLNGGPLSRTRGILVETMQLVEPRKELPVPNHLLESKIYSKIAQNEVVQARPAVLHFGGFEPGKMQKQFLHLANVSSEVERMHIIPPQTKYFSIKYTKGDRLVPGLTLDCVVEFTPDEWRYFYDCIRIHTKGEENLVIPIHAYPVMNTSDFPKNVKFPPVPLGHSMSKVLPLRCQAPIDFEFHLSYVQPHPAFRVEPMAGLVPANGDVDITVTFTPSEFSTCCMKLQLVISQFNAKPLVCGFTGSSIPGLAKEITEQAVNIEIQQQQQQQSKVLDPRAFSPLDRARSKKKTNTNKTRTSSRGTLLDDTPTEIEYAGIKFPTNLDTPYAVAQVLNQEPGKLRIKDLREVVLAKKGSTAAPSRQMKEALFEMAIRQDVYEERQNQLRWQVKLGDTHIAPQARTDVLEAREDAWKEYRMKRGDPVVEKEHQRLATECTFRRTVREAGKATEELAKFDMYKNDNWAVRHTALTRFQQAARKIIIRLRADAKLLGLRQMALDWGEKKYHNKVTVEQKDKMEEEVERDEKLDQITLRPDKVKSVTFPTYVAPNVKDDMAVDALGSVPYKPTEVALEPKVAYFNLKVPQQFTLMGYMPHDVHESSHNYVPPNLVRPLRSGAEDEIISLAVPEVMHPDVEAINEGDLAIEDVTDTPVPAPVPEAVPLNPPQALFRPIEYPSLHIFNPAPGLQVFQPPLPYAETDADFHLCPLPRYATQGSTHKQYLDRDDTIKGVMSWKRFPSQGLTSLSNTPTLTNVWVPRWDDPFGTEVLDTEVPPLLEGLPEEDHENIAEEPTEDTGAESEGVVLLTPEMVSAEFPLVDEASTSSEEKPRKDDGFPHGNKLPPTNVPMSATGPVPREKREKELEFFLKNKYNRLGRKIQGRVQQLGSLKTNPDLVLK